METPNYSVEFDDYCERHFIKGFEKKYKSAWHKTRIDIEEVCKRIDNMLDYGRADLISTSNQYRLVKLDFSIAGTQISPKKSGNRCILIIDEDIRSVKIVLVYSKNDLGPPNETTKWKQMIKSNYEDVAKLFAL